MEESSAKSKRLSFYR